MVVGEQTGGRKAMAKNAKKSRIVGIDPFLADATDANVLKRNRSSNDSTYAHSKIGVELKNHFCIFCNVFN